jgi:hypothetical protein
MKRILAVAGAMVLALIQGSYTAKALGRRTMLKTFAVTLLAIAMPVGLAQARHVIPGCQPWSIVGGDPAAATCACGWLANHRPLLCHKGQWCHPFQACTN